MPQGLGRDHAQLRAGRSGGHRRCADERREADPTAQRAGRGTRRGSDRHGREPRRGTQVAREVYEAPAATDPHGPHREPSASAWTAPRSTTSRRWARTSPTSSTTAPGGPLRDCLQSFVERANVHLTGDVRIRVSAGLARITGRRSPFSLYDEGLATSPTATPSSGNTPRASWSCTACPTRPSRPCAGLRATTPSRPLNTSNGSATAPSSLASGERDYGAVLLPPSAKSGRGVPWTTEPLDPARNIIMALWDGRFSGGPAEAMQRFGESLSTDLPNVARRHPGQPRPRHDAARGGNPHRRRAPDDPRWTRSGRSRARRWLDPWHRPGETCIWPSKVDCMNSSVR